MNPDLLWAFLTGLAGSLHCLGMCGPLIIAYSLNLTGSGSFSGKPPASANVTHHVAFQTGRILSYSLSGGMVAGLAYIGASRLHDIRMPLTIGGGIALIFSGLVVLGTLSPGSFFGRHGWLNPIEKAMVNCLTSRSILTKAALGFLSGFLPCMLSWAILLKAATSADIISGMLLMFFFGLGTAPALLFTGFFASLFSIKGRLAGERLAGLSIIAMGLVMLWKGVIEIA